jgi:BirA family biotin operon repressor/biotin-[acetyl-CoA-carboxylase] ligase
LTVEVLPEIDSTNTELLRRFKAQTQGAEPTLLLAERQTAGRGRMGRVWSSDATSLTFSLGLNLTPQDWSGLSLVVGLAAAQSLSSDPRLGLKWPNDLWWQERKLGGILIETASSAGAGAGSGAGPTPVARYAVIGIGLNVELPAAEVAQGLSTAPAALSELPEPLTASAALRRVVPAVLAAVREFECTGFAPFAPAFAARDVLKGRAVQLSQATAQAAAGDQGEAAGVDASGALLVHTATGLQRVQSAEVSVRPRS